MKLYKILGILLFLFLSTNINFGQSPSSITDVALTVTYNVPSGLDPAPLANGINYDVYVLSFDGTSVIGVKSDIVYDNILGNSSPAVALVNYTDYQWAVFAEGDDPLVDAPVYGPFVFTTVGPTITLTGGGVSIAENGGFTTLTATASAPIGKDLDITVTYSGTAANDGSDYLNSGAAYPTETITVSNATGTGTTVITGFNDAGAPLLEGDETVIATIDVSSSYVVGGLAQEITITDDEVVSLQTSATPIAENAGSTNYTAVISGGGTNATGAPVVVTIDWTGGTATPTDDFTGHTDATIAMNASSSPNVVVTAVSDKLLEGSESINAVISSITAPVGTAYSGGTVSTTISDDEFVILTATSNSIPETGGNADLTAEVSGFGSVGTFLNALGGDIEVTLDWVFGGPTATNTVDYTRSAENLTIPDGAGASAAITINSVSDVLIDPAETIKATISAVTLSALVGGPDSQTITIVDDETISDYLLEPVRGVTGVSKLPKIKWTNQAGLDADGHDVRIGTDTTTQIIFEGSVFTDVVGDGVAPVPGASEFQFLEKHTGMPLSNDVKYYYQVVSKESADAWHYSYIWHFRVAPSSNLSLYHPADGSLIYTTNTTFSWGNYPGSGLKYTLQIKQQNTAPTAFEWETPTYEFTTTNTTRNVSLNGGLKYWWRIVVKRSSNDDILQCSDAIHFTTNGGASVNVYPSWPIGGAEVYTNSPTLYWYLDTYAPGVSYQVKYTSISNSTTGGELDNGDKLPLDVNIGTASSSLFLQLPSLSSGTTYYWQVRPYYDAIGTFGSWSSVESFKTQGTGTLIVPTPSYPTGDLTIYTTSPTFYWYLGAAGSGLEFEVEIKHASNTFNGTDSIYNSGSSLYLQPTAYPFLPGGYYKWRVRSKNSVPATSSWSSEAYFYIAGGAGNAYPVASWPIGNPTVYTVNPTVSWYLEGSSLGLDAYHVTYREGSAPADWTAYHGGANPKFILPTTQTSFTIPDNLEYGKTYYWAVAAVHSGNHTWAEGSFTIVGGTMEVPILSQPSDGADVYLSTVSLSWYHGGSSLGIVGYELEYSSSDVFHPAVTTTVTPTGTSYTIGGLVPATRYYWRVRSDYGGGQYSVWSGVYYFNYQPSAGPIAPIIGGPSNNLIVGTSAPILSWVPTPDQELVYEIEVAKDESFAESESFESVEAAKKVYGLEESKQYFWRVRAKNSNGEYSQYSSTAKFATDATITDVAEPEISVIPDKFEVSQNYPNPFNPSTSIKFGLSEASFVSIKIYNMLGQEVKTLVNNDKQAGSYSVNWNGENNFGQKVTSGTYIYRVSAQNSVVTKKMILLK